MEIPLPDGNWVNEERKIIEQALQAGATADDTLTVDIKIDDEYPEEVKEAIRERVRQKVEQATGAKAVTKKAVAVEKVAKIEERLKKVEDKEQVPALPEPAIWAKIKQLEKDVETLKKG